MERNRGKVGRNSHFPPRESLLPARGGVSNFIALAAVGRRGRLSSGVYTMPSFCLLHTKILERSPPAESSNCIGPELRRKSFRDILTASARVSERFPDQMHGNLPSQRLIPFLIDSSQPTQPRVTDNTILDSRFEIRTDYSRGN